MAETPIENRYPWLTPDEVLPELPKNPTDRDFAKAYATMLMVYQAQRKETVRLMEAHREERKEILAILRTLKPDGMPAWAKVHSAVLIAQAAAIVWLLLAHHGG